MARIETEIVIQRSKEEVFAYLTDLRNAKDWSTGLVDVTYSGELARGTTGSDTRKMGRKEIVMPWTITSFDPPNQLVFEYERPFPMTSEFSFGSSGAGTRVTCVTDLRPRGFWRLLSPVIAREGKKTDEVQFEKVKAILEGDTENAHVGKESENR